MVEVGIFTSRRGNRRLLKPSSATCCFLFVNGVEAQLDEVSDEEDTPLEQVVKVAKKTEAKKRAPRKVKDVSHEIEIKEIEQPIQQQYYAPTFSFA